MKERRMKAHCGGMGLRGRDLRERIRRAEERDGEREREERRVACSVINNIPG